jgi:multiple sugar transport system substrate-binding protein
LKKQTAFRVSGLALCSLASVGLLAGCGGNGTTSGNGSGSSSNGSGPITITFWNTGTNNGSQEVVNAFNKKYAGQYQVVYKDVPYNNETEAVNSALSAHKAPDIMEESFTPSVTYSKQGLVEPILPILQAAGIDPTKDFPASMWGPTAVAGVHYVAPTNTLDTLLFYNKKLFQQAGLDPSKPPTTESEFVADAQKLTDKSKGIWGYVQQPAWPNQFFFPSMLAQFGGKLANPATKQMLFNSQAGVNALQFEWNTIYKWKVSPQNASNNEYVNLFQKGQNAMVMDGEYDYQPFQKALGNDLGVAALPVIGSQQANFLGQNYWWIFKSPSLNAAKKKGIGLFMKYYYVNWSPKVAAAGTLPAWEDTINSQAVQNSPILQLQAEQLKYGVLNPAISNWGTTTSQPLYTEITNALLNKETPKQALDKAAQKMTQTVASLN